MPSEVLAYSHQCRRRVSLKAASVAWRSHRNKWPTFGPHPVEKEEQMFKTDRFRYDFVMVLDGYQFPGILGNRQKSSIRPKSVQNGPFSSRFRNGFVPVSISRNYGKVGGSPLKPPVPSEGLASSRQCRRRVSLKAANVVGGSRLKPPVASEGLA